MATKEFSAYKASHVLEPASYSTTQTSAALDTMGYASVTLLIAVGLWTEGTFDFSLTECDTSGGIYGAVAAANEHTSIKQVASTATDGSIQTIQYTGSKRYLKLVATAGDTPIVVFGALALLTNPQDFGGAIV